MIACIMSGMPQKVYFGYLHGYPHNQHENNDHCPFKIGNQIVIVMVKKLKWLLSKPKVKEKS